MGGFRDAGLQRPLNRRLGEVLGGVGVSTGGNTAGTTGTVFGPAVLVGVSGVTLSQSTRGNQATISIIASAEAGVAIGAGTQTASTGTVVFSNSNNVTFGLSGQTLTASAAAAGPSISVEGASLMTSGTVDFSNLAINSTNGAVVSFGLAGQTITARAPGAIALLRIVAGTLDTTYRPIAPAGLSNSIQLVINGNVSHSALDVDTPRLSIQAVANAAGTQTATIGTVVFSNSNGVTFGMSNSSVVTASYSQSTGPGALAAGTQTATSGTVVFSNSNGVSFGLSNSSVVTASVTREPSIAAGTQTGSSGTIAFSNSNGVTFGMSNSSVVTASYSQSTAPAAIAAGTQTGSSGTIVFSNSAIEFGMSGSTQITAQPKRVSYMVNNGYDRGVFLGDISVGTLWFAPFYIYAPISATRLDVLLAISNSSSAAGTVSMDFAFYTLSGSTANALLAGARAFSYNSTMASSSYTQISGTRYRSMGLGGGFNFTPGQYLLGWMYKLTTGLTSGTYQAFGGRDVSIVANEFPLGLGTAPAYWNGGFYSVSSGALPASVHLTDVVSTGSNDIVFTPFVTLAGTF